MSSGGVQGRIPRSETRRRGGPLGPRRQVALDGPRCTSSCFGDAPQVREVFQGSPFPYFGSSQLHSSPGRPIPMLQSQLQSLN